MEATFLTPKIEALEKWDHPEYGPLIWNAHVAELFGINTEDARQWRASGRLRAKAVRGRGSSYYRVSEVIDDYRRLHPDD